MLRPANRIRTKLDSSKLQKIKDRTKCLICHKPGHWKNECPQRARQSMRKVLVNHVEALGNTEESVSTVLLAFVDDNDDYFA